MQNQTLVLFSSFIVLEKYNVRWPPDTTLKAILKLNILCFTYFHRICTLRVPTHIVIKKKFIFSYNDLDIQIHIFPLLLSA